MPRISGINRGVNSTGTVLKSTCVLKAVVVSVLIANASGRSGGERFSEMEHINLSGTSGIPSGYTAS